jgi:hypothetical protein
MKWEYGKKGILYAVLNDKSSDCVFLSKFLYVRDLVCVFLAYIWLIIYTVYSKLCTNYVVNIN